MRQIARSGWLASSYRRFSGGKASKSSRQKCRRRMAFEPLESRQLMTAVPSITTAPSDPSGGAAEVAEDLLPVQIPELDFGTEWSTPLDHEKPLAATESRLRRDLYRTDAAIRLRRGPKQSRAGRTRLPFKDTSKDGETLRLTRLPIIGNSTGSWWIRASSPISLRTRSEWLPGRGTGRATITT